MVGSNLVPHCCGPIVFRLSRNRGCYFFFYCIIFGSLRKNFNTRKNTRRSMLKKYKVVHLHIVRNLHDLLISVINNKNKNKSVKLRPIVVSYKTIFCYYYFTWQSIQYLFMFPLLFVLSLSTETPFPNIYPFMASIKNQFYFNGWVIMCKKKTTITTFEVDIKCVHAYKHIIYACLQSTM